MASLPIDNSRSNAWQDIRRKSRTRFGDAIAAKLAFLVSASVLAMILLILLFVAREALPVILGKTNGPLEAKTYAPGELEKLNPADLRTYLGLSPRQFAALDNNQLRALMEAKIEEQKELSGDKDAGLNTTQWRYLLPPYQWSGYQQPEYIWQPVSRAPKYNLMPLFIGTLKTTFVALLFATPLALGAAIYVSQLSPPRWREILKPTIELLASVPSVVLGFFALMVLAGPVQSIFGTPSPLNALLAGIALGFAVIPLIFTLAEDALTSVPRSYTQAALALGASKWQTAWHIALPSALPGIGAAVVLGFGRAIGETMVVLMASGNASIISWSALDSTRTMTATIAAELAESVFGSNHYRILFLVGTLLLIVSWITNSAASWLIRRLQTSVTQS